MDEEVEQASSARSQRSGGRAGRAGRGGSGGQGGMQRGGSPVVPGTYKAVFSYGGESDSVLIVVDIDPREDYKMSDLLERKKIAGEFQKKANLLTDGSSALKAAKASIDLINQQIPRGRSDELKELRDKTKAVEDSLSSIMDEISPPRDEKAQGIVRGTTGVQSIVSSAQRGISRGFGPITGTQKTQLILAEKKLKSTLGRINKFFIEIWPEYKSFIGASALTPFTDKEFKSLKW